MASDAQAAIIESDTPSTATCRILLVRASKSDPGQYRKSLEAGSMKPAVDVADDADVAKKLLAQHKYQIVCTDLQMPGFDGIQFLRRVQAKRRPIAVIIITDQATIEQAVLVMRLGAHDVLVKPVDASHLQEVVEQAYRERALQFELDLLRDYLQQRFTTHTVVSKNLRMHEILGMLARLAQTSSTILLEGGPGTGKAL